MANDRIVEISLLKIKADGKEETKTMRINPEMPIPPQSTEIHGISDEDVKDEPTCNVVAKEVAKVIEWCELAGYNSNKFDIPLLAEEFLKVGGYIVLKKHRFVVAQVLFHKMEQRT